MAFNKLSSFWGGKSLGKSQPRDRCNPQSARQSPLFILLVLIESPANTSYSHRWDRDINEWVKMSDDEGKKSKAAAEQRKKEELEKQGRI